MEIIDKASKLGKDFLQGALDTLIVAPFEFGMFLGNLSGLAGKNNQLKAQSKLLVAQQALSAMLYNTGGARDYITKELGEDFLKRPGYYMGSFASGLMIKAPSAITKATGKVVDLNKAEQISNKLFATSLAVGGKTDMILNKIYDNFLDYMSKTYQNNYNDFNFADFLKINFNFGDYPNQYFNPYISPTIYDPLVLDLDGDGVEALSLKDGVYFDHNGDGVKFKSSWTYKDDGLLVIDKNSDGIIDNGNELFGNFSKLNSSNHLAINGFHSLKEYDTNNDRIIDINDKEFKNLKVWQDKNSNRISQSDELKTLDELGIKYLNTKFSNEIKNIDKDNILEFSSTYTKTNKTNLKLADINFKVDTTSSLHKEKLTLTDEENKRANIKGYGFLRDLKEAATLSTNLAKTLDEYTIANTKEEQLNLIQTLVKEYSDTANKVNNYELKRANLINNDLIEIKILNLVSSLESSNLEIRDKNQIYKEIKELSLKASDDRFKVLNSMK